MGGIPLPEPPDIVFNMTDLGGFVVEAWIPAQATVAENPQAGVFHL